MIDKSISADPRDPLCTRCPVCGGHEYGRPFEPANTVLQRLDSIATIAGGTQ